MPLATLAPTISPTGISAPTYDAILQSLKETFQGIYGSDAYLAADSQDGQWLAAQAKAFSDQNQAMIATYSSYRPSYAQGVGLSSMVKINGLDRQIASFSTAVGNVTGVNGTVVTNGVVSDNNGNKWNLPATVTIPGAGFISVTVTAQQEGAIAALLGTINKIQTPTNGWQSFISTADAVPGLPVESDATLRKRQAVSTSFPANSPLAGTLAALLDLPGVTRARVYENSTGSTDGNGIPARNISVIIEGGDVLQIATTIGQKKTPGPGTYGNTTQNYTDPITGIVYAINFYVLADQAVTVEMTVTALNGWSTTVQAAIQQAVSDYINAIGIGNPVQISRIWAPSYLNGSVDGFTYEITALTIDGAGVDVVIPFNKAPSCDPSNVIVTVSP